MEKINQIKKLLEDIQSLVSEIAVAPDQGSKLEIDLLNKKIIDLYEISRQLGCKEKAVAEVVYTEAEFVSAFIHDNEAEIISDKRTEEHVEPQNQEIHSKEEEVIQEKEETPEPEKEEETKPEQQAVEEIIEVEVPEDEAKLPPLPVQEELRKAADEQIQKKALHETFARPEKSLNEKFGSSQTKMALADSLSKGPISDIKTAISLNLKLTFIKELFSGDQKEYKRFIEFLTKCQNYSEAKMFLQSETEKHKEWETKTELIDIFIDLITRRFRS